MANSKYLALLILFFISGCASSNPIIKSQEERLHMALEYSNDKSGNALLVWVDGELILEEYSNNYGPNKPHPLTEASTILSGLQAIAVNDDGKIQLNQPASKIINEWNSDKLKSKITIYELLNLTSGLKTKANIQDYKNVKTFESALSTEAKYKPGEKFQYDPTPYQIFGMIIRRTVEGYNLKERILIPIGIPGGRWQTTSHSKKARKYLNGDISPRRFDGSSLTAREFGTIGNLLLQNGKWHGETIVENTGMITETTSSNPYFGLGVWVNTSHKDTSSQKQIPRSIIPFRDEQKLICDCAPSTLYMAAGRFNQRLYILPSIKMVVVRLGGANLTWNDSFFLNRLLLGKKSNDEF
jgi:CubicO group peptidase (beta-lactamase class C family)